jgi:hypothetical protein
MVTPSAVKLPKATGVTYGVSSHILRNDLRVSLAFRQVWTCLVIGLAGQILRPLDTREIAANHAARPRFPRFDAD